MQRLDWTLIRPPRPSRKKAPLKRQLRRIDELEAAIEARVHEATRRLLTEDEVEQLAELEERLEDVTIASCEAAHAPRVRDDPDCETRLLDEYADADTDLELDDFLEMRRQDFDCERCPHAAKYSLFPQDPCEISVGPLLEALEGSRLLRALTGPMGPDDMRTLADALERVLEDGAFRTLVEVDVTDVINHAARYLRFWGRLGFGVRPELIEEEAPLHTPEGPIGAPGTGQRTLLH